MLTTEASSPFASCLLLLTTEASSFLPTAEASSVAPSASLFGGTLLLTEKVLFFDSDASDGGASLADTMLHVSSSLSNRCVASSDSEISEKQSSHTYEHTILRRPSFSSRRAERDRTERCAQLSTRNRAQNSSSVGKETFKR